MNATRILLGTSLLLSIVLGCAAAAPSPAASDRPSRTLRVFIETFEDAPDSPGSGRTFTPIFMTALKGISASTNTRYIQSTKKETAEAVITGRITVWEDGGWTKQATVGFEAQCVHTASGDVLWSVADVSRPFTSSRENRTPEYVSRAAATHGLKLIRDQL